MSNLLTCPPTDITTTFADTWVLSDSKTSHLEESVLFRLVAFLPVTILAFTFLAIVTSPSTSVCQSPSRYMFLAGKNGGKHLNLQHKK
jgi:hypothetical protein